MTIFYELSIYIYIYIYIYVYNIYIYNIYIYIYIYIIQSSKFGSIVYVTAVIVQCAIFIKFKQRAYAKLNYLKQNCFLTLILYLH